VRVSGEENWRMGRWARTWGKKCAHCQCMLSTTSVCVGLSSRAIWHTNEFRPLTQVSVVVIITIIITVVMPRHKWKDNITINFNWLCIQDMG
jgi:hypothetical protein